MRNRDLPEKQGLYDPRFEHDSCGVGFVVDMLGRKSNAILEQALTAVCCLNHRGAAGAEADTGDGAGVTIQVPDAFFRAVVPFDLPPAGEYATGIAFLPTDDPGRRAAILAKMPQTARHVMVAALEGLRDFDPDEAAGHVLVPSLYIAADDRPLSDMPRFFALAPEMLFGQTVGSGHFCQLEVPDQVNAMIERFLTQL